MPFEPPDRTTLLAAATPLELFGEAASDPKALRRAWAALAKVYRAEDDPEAFQHARALYEAARDGGTTPAPAESGAPSPGEELTAAFAAGDGATVVRWVATHGEELLLRDPEAFQAIFTALVVNFGPHLHALTCAHLQAIVHRPDAALSPVYVREVSAELWRAAALFHVHEDQEIPRPMVMFLRGQWHARPDHVAEGWLSLCGELSATALEHTFRRLEHHHPCALGLLNHRALELEAAAVEAAPRRVPPEIASDWRPLVLPVPWLFQEADRGTDRWIRETRIRIGLGSLPLWLGWVGVMTLGGVSHTTFASMLSIGLIVLIAQAAGLGWLEGVRPGRRDAAWRRATQLDGEELVGLARAWSLFPAELARQLLPDEPLPFGEPDDPYPDEHPLMRLLRDPTAPWRCLTPAHVDRLRAAYTKEEPSG